MPYGPRSLQQVRDFSFGITRFLVEQGAQVVVVACNTASAAALHELRAAYPAIRFVGHGACSEAGSRAVAYGRRSSVGYAGDLPRCALCVGGRTLCPRRRGDFPGVPRVGRADRGGRVGVAAHRGHAARLGGTAAGAQCRCVSTWVYALPVRATAAGTDMRAGGARDRPFGGSGKAGGTRTRRSEWRSTRNCRGVRESCVLHERARGPVCTGAAEAGKSIGQRSGGEMGGRPVHSMG